MSDLISRRELLKRFCITKDGHRIPERDCDNFEVTVSVKDIKSIIREQLTAYDIDKVVEELKKIEEHCLEMNDWQGQSAVVDAIEIVKQGYASDDVCEWESDYKIISDKYKRVTGCGHEFYDLHHAVPFKFCPYCGKKIKIVGD